MAALLWSQLVLAVHPGCITGMHMPARVVATASMPGCEHDAPPQPEPACHSHCSQGGLSSDVARVPPVPPLPAMPVLPLVALIVTPQATALVPANVAGPPPVSWHRPTAHPAALLLI